MDILNMPVRWPIYFFLCVIAAAGLIVDLRARLKHNGGIAMQDYIFRWPLIFTFIYGVIQVVRTVYIWIDPGDGYAIRLFQDPPLNSLLAPFTNGILLSWVVVYILFRYSRGHPE